MVLMSETLWGIEGFLQAGTGGENGGAGTPQAKLQPVITAAHKRPVPVKGMAAEKQTGHPLQALAGHLFY
jgi:hypothetical protein